MPARRTDVAGQMIVLRNTEFDRAAAGVAELDGREHGLILLKRPENG
jgi:hypothetical protein